MHTDFTHITVVRVRYSETDQMGICYYGNYAQYCEVGRVEAMRSLGMSYKELEDQGIMLPVSEFSISYFNPAHYDDELTVSTQIVEVRGARLYFRYLITLNDGKKIATASTTLVFVKKDTLKPIAAPTFFINLLNPFCCE